MTKNFVVDLKLSLEFENVSETKQSFVNSTQIEFLNNKSSYLDDDLYPNYNGTKVINTALINSLAHNIIYMHETFGEDLGELLKKTMDEIFKKSLVRCEREIVKV